MTQRKWNRRGVTLVYSAFAMTALGLMSTLAVDFGRVRAAKMELQNAVDAAARAAAAQIASSSSNCKAAAVSAAALNTVEGTAVSLNSSTDVDIGVWNQSARTFTVTSTSPNAVRVRGARTTARGNPINITFGTLIGRSTCDVNATAVATMNSTNVTATTSVSGAANPFGAAMNDTWLYDPWGGEMVSAVGAGQASISVIPGQRLTFSTTGTTSWQYWQGSGSYIGAEGWPWMQSNMYPDNHSNADLIAPSMSLVGVFASDSAPSGTKPATLDFTTTAAQDYTTLQPLVNQPFFIGDGQTSTGTTQTIIVPPGATRLFFGVNDSVAWRDNGGSLNVTTTIKQTVLIVK